MIIHRRVEWGASPNSPAAYSSQFDGLIIHWNGPSLGSYSRAQVPGIIAGTYKFHTVTNGWQDIAYNFSLDRFGEFWEGRGQDRVNAASGDTYANNYYTALELLIGTGDPFTEAMKASLKEFYTTRSYRKIFGHRDVTPTECPGNEIYSFLKGITQFSINTPILLPKGTNKVPDYILKTPGGSYFAFYNSGYARELVPAELIILTEVLPEDKRPAVGAIANEQVAVLRERGVLK